MKRDDYISWDDYFMGVALLSARDLKIQTPKLAPVSLTRIKNSWCWLQWFPTGLDDDDFPWDRNGTNYLETKYPLFATPN